MILCPVLDSSYEVYAPEVPVLVFDKVFASMLL